MKKIVSMILVIALFASLAVAVSAHSPMNKVESFIEHAYTPAVGSEYMGGWPGDWCKRFNNVNWANAGAVFVYERVDGETIKNADGSDRLFTIKEICDLEYRRSSDMTKILSKPEKVELGRVSCAEAITSDEMKAAVEAWNAAADEDHQIAHMTVFKQRKLTGVQDGDTIDIRLWPVGKKNAAVVLTQTAEGWKIVAVSDKNEDTVMGADLTGATGFVVCMTW